MVQKKHETMPETIERVMDAMPNGVFPARTVTGYHYQSGTNISRIVWHQFKASPKSEAEFSKSECGEADFSVAELPRKFRYEFEPLLCEECVRYGSMSRAEFRACALAIMEDTKAARVKQHD